MMMIVKDDDADDDDGRNPSWTKLAFLQHPAGKQDALC